MISVELSDGAQLVVDQCRYGDFISRGGALIH